MTLPLPHPYLGGAFEKPKSLEELAEMVQKNLDFIAQQFPVTASNLQFEFAGAGSPEGVITAPVGARFRRTDGGAGTALYIKESGTGNTGWVGK